MSKEHCLFNVTRSEIAIRPTGITGNHTYFIVARKNTGISILVKEALGGVCMDASSRAFLFALKEISE